MSFLQPRITKHNREFWEGVARGELLAQRCVSCARLIFPPRMLCPSCLSDRLDWLKLSGKGRLYSWTQIHFKLAELEPPWILGVIQLQEGFRMISRLDAHPDQLRIGMELELGFWDTPQGRIFIWRPAGVESAATQS